MSLDISINLNSLQMIREEVVNTIEQSAVDFEAYMADQDSVEHIQDSAAGMAQVGGTFRMLEYPGAALLADETATLINYIASLENTPGDNIINALTNAFFMLPRYIEFIMMRQSALPILIIPTVNELRIAGKQSLLPEYHFYSMKGTTLATGLEPVGSSEVGELLSSIGRLRHMYQTGLLGVINQKRPGTHYYQLMARSISRAVGMMGAHEQQPAWRLASAVLECFAAGTLELTINRKRILANIEKMLRQVVSKGEHGLNQAMPDSVITDLLFLLMLSPHHTPEVDAVRQAYSLNDTPDLDDKELVRQRELMHGPGQDAIESVSRLLKEELHQAKDVLEISSQNNMIDSDDYATLQSTLERIADTLMILNLTGPQQTLKLQLEKVALWSDKKADLETADFLEVADTVLFIENSLSVLERGKISLDEINEGNEHTRNKIVAGSYLAETEKLVIAEAEAGIALAKRAITSYVDSNFDAAHVANVVVTLDTVRGGLQMLNYNRAAAVLKSSSAFVESHMKQTDAGNQRHQLLETLADALISLEYYLNEISVGQTANDKILEVAEESLAALGFAVDGKPLATEAEV